MLSVIIQPRKYKRSYTIEDVDRIIVAKFSHKALFEDDYNFKVIYDSKLPDDECLKLLAKNLEEGTLITYNRSLFVALLNTISSETNYDINSKNALGLMEFLAHQHFNGTWPKLTKALEFYDFFADIDTSNPMDMIGSQVILYRLMQKYGDI